jgi:hypothetical protein
MMFIVSLIEFSKHVQNEISAKVMPKRQNFTGDFADRTKQKEGVKSTFEIFCRDLAKTKTTSAWREMRRRGKLAAFARGYGAPRKTEARYQGTDECYLTGNSTVLASSLFK